MSTLEWSIEARLSKQAKEPGRAESGAVEHAGSSRHEHGLIERSRKGDLDAYERLLLAHERVAYWVAYSVTGDAEDAEDALQEAFVKALKALSRFRRGAPFKPWLLAIVANEARTRSRSRRRHAAIATRAVEREPGIASESAEAGVLLDDQRRRLLEAVEQLPEKMRAVVTCRYLLELSEEETAATLRIRRGTVKSRLSRALDKLEVLLGAADA
ncbi:MAG: RNA polymerase sigma factor [Solirubrobacteraceae bacterium]